ncbi:MAG: right-handed parallel beta-helix repeat-containing protein [Candidatus Babeliales bacterium]
MNIFLYYMVLGIASVFNTVEIFAQELATTRGSLGCVATAIGSSGGFTITQPGKYCLSRNVTVSSSGVNGITITANNVDLDLNGFTISGPGGSGTGNIISVSGASNVRISNGTVRNAERSGIVLTSASGVYITNITAAANSFAGFELVGCFGCIIQNCIARDNTSSSNVFGITTMNGTSNIFDACIISAISTSSSTFGTQAAGIYIDSTENKSSVINCMVSDISATHVNGFPYGIRMQQIDPTLSTAGLPTIDRNLQINQVAWSPDGRFLAFGATGGIIEVYELRTNQLLFLNRYTHPVLINSIDWSPDGRYLLFGSDNNGGGGELGMLEFDGVSLVLITPLFEMGVGVKTVKWAPNGRFVAIGTNAGGFSVLNFSRQVASLFVSLVSFTHGAQIQEVHWSFDNRYILFGASSNGSSIEAQVLEFGSIGGTYTLTSRATINVSNTIIISARWSPSGQYFAIGEAGTGGVRVFEFSGTSASQVASAGLGTYTGQKIRWSQDGRYLFQVGIVSSTNTITAYSFSGSALTPVATNTVNDTLQTCSLSPDGTLLVTGENSNAGVGNPEVVIFSALRFATNCVLNNNEVKNIRGASTGQAGANNGFGIVASTAQNQVTNNSCFRNDLNYAFSINVFEQFIANLKASTPLPFANFAFPTP